MFFVGVGTEQGGIVYEVDPFSGKRTTTPKRTRDGETVISQARRRGHAGARRGRRRSEAAPLAAERGEVDPMPIVEALRAVNRGLATKQVKEMRTSSSRSCSRA